MKRLTVITALIFIFLFGVIYKVGADDEALYKLQWNNLTSQIINAYQKKDYKTGIMLALKAYEHAAKYLGKFDPNTLSSINNLAFLYQADRNYRKAEQLYNEALRLRSSVLGKDHPETLSTANNLALLYQAEGRYEKAEQLYKHTLELRRKVLGTEHAHTLSSLNNLAGLYHALKRYDEAEPLLEETLALRTKILGEEHPETLTSINNLGGLYYSTGEYEKAKPLLEKALRLRMEKLGEEHTDDIASSMYNLGLLYREMERYGEAESIFKESIAVKKKILGADNNPKLLYQINNLGLLYNAWGKYEDAKSIYENLFDTFSMYAERFHPEVLMAALNYIIVNINMGENDYAFDLLKRFEGRLFSRSFEEAYYSSNERVKRAYNAAVDMFGNILISFAVKNRDNENYELYASDMIIRRKHILLKQTCDNMRLALIKSRLGIKEEYYDEELHHTYYTDSEQILSNMEEGAALIEFYEYKPVDFKTCKAERPRFAATFLLSDMTSDNRIFFSDIADLEDIRDIFYNSKKSASKLYIKLLGGFEGLLAKAGKLYIAPDGFLNRINFASLVSKNNEFLVKKIPITRVLSGKDFINRTSAIPKHSFIMAANLNYTGNKDIGSGFLKKPVSKEIGKISAFNTEPGAIADIYKKRGGKNFISLSGNDASEEALKSIENPPLILNLGTYSFYLQDRINDSDITKEADLLSSGVIMSGANLGMRGILNDKGDEGILYGVEILELNLKGTELAAIASCITSKDSKDYSQAIYGLIQAFRTAGVKNLIIPIAEVTEKTSEIFMKKFYDIWFNSEIVLTPAEALHKTRLYFIDHEDEPLYRKPEFWSKYVVIGE